MSALRALARAAVALAPFLMVSGCSIFGGSSAEVTRCPHVAIMPDLQAVARFGPGSSRQESNVVYGARMLNTSSNCDLDKKRGGITVNTKLGVLALRTSTEVQKGQVTYLVAVVDRNSQILTERDFAIEIEFPSNQRRLEITEEHTMFIPMPKDRAGDDYGVIFGFRLTPDELEYNRAHATRNPG